MHTMEEIGTHVATFLLKLWKIVEDPETNEMIAWTSTGASFYIRKQARFSAELLPLNFKHNNMASFIRQLNMYGFHKIASLEGGGLKPDKDEMEFAHQFFIQGHPYLLEHIKRKVHKVPAMKEDLDGKETAEQPGLMKRVLNDVKGLKGKQESVSSQLTEMKRENEVLWREVAVLRQKHLKQQQIVNKLIQFLVSMVHTSRNGGIGIKRHYPIMLSNMPHSANKKSKHTVDDMQNLSPGGPVIHELDADLLDDCAPSSEEIIHNEQEYLAADFGVEPESAEVPSPTPTIDSIDLVTAVNTSSPEMLLELAEECSLSSFSEPKHAEPKITKLKTKKTKTKPTHKKRPKVSAPQAVPESQGNEPNDSLLDIILPSVMNDDNAQDGLGMRLCGDDDSADLATATHEAISDLSNVAAKNVNTLLPSTSATSLSPNMTLACTDSSEISRCGLTEDLDLHLDSMDSELDSLKELLKGEGYSLDANTLFGLFSEDPYAYELPMPMESEVEPSVKPSGSELMAYTSNMDLVDMLESAEDDWKLPNSPEPSNLDDDMHSEQT